MSHREECLMILKSCTEELKQRFGVRALQLFGSFARNEQKPDSDVDLCVDMAPKMILLLKLKSFLEQKLGRAVDLVRIHKNMNPQLLEEINKDGIQII